MGACSSHVAAAGGKIISVIPEPLAPRELSGQSRGHVFYTQDMHERKKIMFALSDAFIALPGGLGTYEEIVEACTWTKLGIHTKPVGLLNTGEFYAGLLQQVDASTRAQFIPPHARAALCDHTEPAALLDALVAMLTMPTVASSQPEWPVSALVTRALAEVAAQGDL